VITALCIGPCNGLNDIESKVPRPDEWKPSRHQNYIGSRMDFSRTQVLPFFHFEIELQRIMDHFGSSSEVRRASKRLSELSSRFKIEQSERR
jgi:hypothetical protein